MQPIKPLDKVMLTLSIKPPLLSNLSSEPIAYEFIYGIGTYGFSPLEKAIGSKTDGTKVEIKIKAMEWKELFGHLPLPKLDAVFGTKELKITARIISVTPAASREVIQALANSTGCSGGCGCGCG